jgi:predicted nucleic acid-binding protein
VTYLLDTCVVSELIARHPHPDVVRWVDRVDEDMLFLSVITIGEVQRGVARIHDSPRKRELQAWLQDDLLVRFGERILPIDVEVMLAWGELAAQLDRQGRRMPAMDSVIAATCLGRGLTLVTRDVADFLHSGVELLNPWPE